MAISARLRATTQATLTRYCKERGLTKTAALERGIQLLLEQDTSGAHPAYLAFKQLRLVPEPAAPNAKRPARSSDAMRDAIRAKYSR